MLTYKNSLQFMFSVVDCFIFIKICLWWIITRYQNEQHYKLFLERDKNKSFYIWTIIIIVDLLFNFYFIYVSSTSIRFVWTARWQRTVYPTYWLAMLLCWSKTRTIMNTSTVISSRGYTLCRWVGKLFVIKRQTFTVFSSYGTEAAWSIQLGGKRLLN